MVVLSGASIRCLHRTLRHCSSGGDCGMFWVGLLAVTGSDHDCGMACLGICCHSSIPRRGGGCSGHCAEQGYFGYALLQGKIA
jgi:hypothetical protein